MFAALFAAPSAPAQAPETVRPPTLQGLRADDEPPSESSGSNPASRASLRKESSSQSTRAGSKGVAVSPVSPMGSQIVSPPIVAWSVPEGCPDAGTVDERARTLASVDAATWARAGGVRGHIVGEAGDWVLSLQIERASGAVAPAPSAAPVRAALAPPSAPLPAARSSAAATPVRVFHAGDCAELGEAAAVAIALALGGAERRSSVSVGRDGEGTPPAAATRSRDEGRASLAAELRSTGAEARAEAWLDTASLGGVALGAGVELGMRWRALGVRAYGLGLPSRQVRLAPSQYVELSLWAAGLRGCYRAAAGLPIVDVCGGGEVGAFGAAARGLAEARERRDLWSASTLGTWFGVELVEHVHAGARVEAVIPWSRERYFVNQNERVHDMSGASLRLALSLGGTLGSE